MTQGESRNRGLLAHVAVPFAGETDVRATARALGAHDPGRVTALRVVGKGGGVPDETPVERSEKLAAAFAALRGTFTGAADRIACGRDVVAAVLEAAGDEGASAIAFRPRGGSRIVELLGGDRTRRLVTEADRPVVALPAGVNEEGNGNGSRGAEGGREPDE